MNIQNPHDKFFKETFSNISVAKDFMENYLPKSVKNIIDIDTLEPQKDSFVNKELKEVFSDMLFRVNINKREGYIYFLFEHKSYISKNISFQLLKYMIEIWETKLKKEKIDKLPMIIPLVIYHGRDEWKIKTTLGEMIKGYEELPEDVKNYLPNYEYLLYDLSKYTDEQIKGEIILRIFVTAFRDIFSKDGRTTVKTVLRAIESLKELKDKQTSIEYFETFIRYILNAGKRLTKEDITDIVKSIENAYPEGSEVVMTLAEQFRQEGMQKGMQKGRQEGMQEGRQESLSKTAIKLLIKKFGKLPEEIKNKILQLETETLEIIIDGIFEYESIEDIKKYI